MAFQVIQELLKYFNGTAVVAFLKTPFVAVFPNNLSLYSKKLKLLSLAMSELKLVATSF